MAGGAVRRRKATVELFEELRREYEFGVGSIAGVARKFGVHRRLVREALVGAIPQQRLAKARPRQRPRRLPSSSTAFWKRTDARRASGGIPRTAFGCASAKSCPR